MRNKYLSLILLLTVTFLASFIGGFVTSEFKEPWYSNLILSNFSPPSWLFAPVWTTLYIFMSIAIWRVWQKSFEVKLLKVYLTHLFFNISWDQVSDSLEQTPVKLANEEIEALKKDESFLSLSDLDKQDKTDEIREKYENSSRINPFRTSHVEDFNFWYFLIGIIGILYGSMSWQGSQAYNSSAKSASLPDIPSAMAIHASFPD